MTERELVECGALIRVADHNLTPAREFARTFLDMEQRGNDMAMEG